MHENQFAPLLVVVLLAMVVPLVLSRFRQLRLPVVVGEILAGIIVGRSGLGIVANHDPVLDLLAEFGFAFLFFLAGTEIDFSNLMPASRRPGEPRKMGPVSIGAISFGITLAMSAVIAWYMYSQGTVENPIIMVLVLAPSALGIIVSVLKESGHAQGKFGQAALVAGLVADFGTLILFTVFVAVYSSGLTLEVLLIGMLFVVFFLLYRFGDFIFNRIPGVRRVMSELSSATSQLKIRAAFAMLLLFVVLAEVVGAEIVLGAFLAGVILALLRTPEDADAFHQLEAVGYGFFIPIFFIMIGVDFELSALLESPPSAFLGVPQAVWLVLLLLLAAFGVKLVPALAFRLGGFGWQATLAAGVLLSSRLSLIVAESTIGLNLGMISPSLNAAIIVTAMLLATVAPLGFTLLAPKRPDEERELIVITGAGSFGLQLAEQLETRREHVVLLDSSSEHVRRAKQMGYDAEQVELDLQEPAAAQYLEQATTLVNALTDPELSYAICSRARTVFGIDKVYTQVTDPADLPRFERLGVTAVNVAVNRAAFLATLVRNPGLFKLLTYTEDENEVSEVEVRNRASVGKPLRELHLPGDVLIMAIRRGGELLVPHGHTHLAEGDRLTLAGSSDCVDSAIAWFSGRQPA